MKNTIISPKNVFKTRYYLCSVKEMSTSQARSIFYFVMPLSYPTVISQSHWHRITEIRSQSQKSSKNQSFWKTRNIKALHSSMFLLEPDYLKKPHLVFQGQFVTIKLQSLKIYHLIFWFYLLITFVSFLIKIHFKNC